MKQVIASQVSNDLCFIDCVVVLSAIMLISLHKLQIAVVVFSFPDPVSLSLISM